MKKTKVTLRIGSTEDFFNRLRDHAEKLDMGETLPPGITITFEEPEDLLEVLTSERVRLLRRVKEKSQQISVLATGLKRDSERSVGTCRCWKRQDCCVPVTTQILGMAA
jgi:predicted transcriptional regulator